MFKKKESQIAEQALAKALLLLWALIQRAFDEWSPDEPIGPYLSRFFSKHEKQFLGAIMGVGAAGGATATIAAWSASLGLVGKIGVWLGLVSMPFWVPVAGVLAGGLIGGGGALVVSRRMRERDATRVAELLAPVRSVVAFTNLTDDDARAETIALYDVLLGMGANRRRTSKMLIDDPVRSVEQFDVDPTRYTSEERRSALVDAWLLSIRHDLRGPKARSTHERLCTRLGLPVASIRAEAEDKATKLSAEIGAIFDATCFLVRDATAPGLSEVLNSVLEMDPIALARQRRQSAISTASNVAAVAGAIAAVTAGQPQLLGAIGKAYSAARAVLEFEGPAPTEKVQALFDRTATLAEGFGISRERATELVAPIEDQIRKAAGQVRSKKGT